MKKIAALLFLFCKFAPHLSEDSSISTFGKETLKETVTLLQVMTLNVTQKETTELFIENENCRKKNIIRKQKIEKDVNKMKEEYETKIDELIKDIAEKREEFNKTQNDQKERIKRTQEGYEETLMKLKAVNVKKEAAIKKDQEKEMKKTEIEYENQIER